MAPPSSMDPLGLAKVFVKTVVRMFYETEHIVIVDALVFHSALSLADMVLVLDWGKNQKGAAKLVGKLKEGGLISVYTRQEMREGAMKSVNREYYYIDYRRAIDATKYKLHMLDDAIKRDAAPTQEKKELQCRQCKAQWTHLEVMEHFDPLGRESGFLCKDCGDPLIELSHVGEAVDNGDIPAKFNKFFGPLLKLMEQIDQVTIPAIEGQDALADAIELPRDKDVNPAARHQVVPEANARPTAVKGLQTVVPDKVEVSIATDSEYTVAARVEEQARQAKIAAQNQLPDWHTKSTVRDADHHVAAQSIKSAPNGVETPTIKTELVDEKKGKETNLDDVFAQLAEEQAQKDAKEAQESGDDDDDDDDEFEDVGLTRSAVPDAKRVKLDSLAPSAAPSAAPSPAPGATPAASTGDGGDESDEDEFVDV